MTFIIRKETDEDASAVYSVNESAFGRPEEARLVDAMRRGARACVSLVAVAEGRVVGHIFFSPVGVESEGETFEAMALAPMAVLPELQNQGVGSRLVTEGLRECLRLGRPLVFVLGHPEYYPRFGFAPARPRGFTCEYDVPDEVFMVAELSPGAADGRAGLVRYRPEFADV